MKSTKLTALILGLAMSSSVMAQNAPAQPQQQLKMVKRVSYCTSVAGDVKVNSVVQLLDDGQVASKVSLKLQGKEVLQKEGSQIVFLDVQKPMELKALKASRSADGKVETRVTGTLRLGIVVDMKDGTDLAAPKQGDLTPMSGYAYLLCENTDTFDVMDMATPNEKKEEAKKEEKKEASSEAEAGAGATP